ncbi:MAG: cytochrome c oxidase accessory protein CcoG, partial [Chthoniobacterales bacterium]|nr:cytochrome c oxidase accessory protein CcoG [Chthoniobacterales bacterium]
VWCGWTCPQTVFLDHVVRRIERLLEGDAPSRRRLDEMPWTVGKIVRRGVKHVLFFVFAWVVAHTFVSYFVSAPVLWGMMWRSPAENWGLFLFVVGMSVALYVDFAWFREQFCIVLCPYGRFQSALVDENTIVVGYDERRGEPRGKPGSVTGDCIDCRRCVQVCPTGIDIRHGLQMECIGCEACIDACDEVMERLGRPKGLIRHDSLSRFAGREWKFFRPRVYLYLFFAVVGMVAFVVAIGNVKPVTLFVTRMQGAPYIRDGGMIRNQFLVRLGNKKGEMEKYWVRVKGEVEGLVASGVTSGGIELRRGEEIVEPLVLIVPDEAFRGNFAVEVEVVDGDGKVVQKREVPFLGPYRSGGKK